MSCKKIQSEGSNIPLLNGNDSMRVTAVSVGNGEFLL